MIHTIFNIPNNKNLVVHTIIEIVILFLFEREKFI